MTLAALIFTALAAGAALWTVRLSYRSIGLSQESAKSSEDSARSGADAARAAAETAKAAEETAKEVRLGRVRDRLESERLRLRDLIELIEEMQFLQPIVVHGSDLRWIHKQNLLRSMLSGSEETFPAAASIPLATSPQSARLSEARGELNEAILAIEIRIHDHDFG